MRDEDDGGVDRRQLALEPLEALDVEVVGGLVEEQQVGVAGERPAERGACQLAAGERLELPVEVVVVEAEPAQDGRGAVAPVPAAGVLEPRLRLAVAAHRRVVVHPARHRLLELAELLLDPDEVGGARERVLAQRQAPVARRALVVQRDPRALLQRELAALDRRLADDRAEQRRLAGAVLAREREPLAAVDRERDPVEERIPGELLAEVGSDQDGHGTRVDAADVARPICSTPVASDPRTQTIDTIRALAMDAVQQANAGHPGTAMALAPVAYLLYRDVMRHNPADPHWPDRDRFVLSAGHACMLQYAALHLAGYDLSLDDLKQFRQWGSRTPGHPEWGHTAGDRDDDRAARPGVRERRRHGDRAALPRRPLQPAAARDRRLVDLRDLLRRRPDGGRHARRPPRSPVTSGSAGSSTSTTTTTSRSTARPSLTFTTEDKGKRFEAYGWHVQHVDDSEDLDALRGALAARRPRRTRPSLIVLRTHIAYPAPNAIDTSKSHGVAARRGRGAGDEGGDGLRPRRDVRRLRRGPRAHGRRRRARRRAAARVGRSGSPPGRRPSRTSRASASSTCAASRARAGARRCPCSRRARRSRPATPARR